MKYAVKTDIGKRLHNEDSYLLPSEYPGVCLFAVADGMGGHAAGAVASKLLVDGLLEGEAAFEPGREVAQLKSAVERVNLTVFEAAEDDAALRGMGSTLVCALVRGKKYIAANVGDSRLYQFGGDALTRVTTDHSYVEQLVRQGVITKEDARFHPQRNIITRAMGVSPNVDVDVFERDWEEGDILLLCSDGLHGAMEEDEIAEVLRSESTLEEMCDALVETALDNGGTDNVTVVLVRCEEGDDA